jgi:hypothetical protein
MGRWDKFIQQKEARELSKEFCEDFKIIYCEVYYVDRIKNDIYAQYMYYNPPHILMLNNLLNPIGVLIQELTHHLECQKYGFDNRNHGYNYQLAKKRVIPWCKKNISMKPDWRLTLKAKIKEEEMKEFEI